MGLGEYKFYITGLLIQSMSARRSDHLHITLPSLSPRNLRLRVASGESEALVWKVNSSVFSFSGQRLKSVPCVIFFEHFCNCYHHSMLRYSTIACPPFQSGLWTMKGRGEGNKKECSAVRVGLLWERKGSLKSFNLSLC